MQHFISEDNSRQSMKSTASRWRGVAPSPILTISVLIIGLLGATTLRLSSGHVADNSLNTAMNQRYGPIPGMINVYFKNEAEPIQAYRTLKKNGFGDEVFLLPNNYQQKYHYYVYVSSGEFDKALAVFRASPLFVKPSILYRNNQIAGHHSPINPYAIGVDSSFAADTASLSSFFAQHPEYTLDPTDPSFLGTLREPNPEVAQMFILLHVTPGSEKLRCQELVQSAAVARCAQTERDTPPGALY